MARRLKRWSPWTRIRARGPTCTSHPCWLGRNRQSLRGTQLFGRNNPYPGVRPTDTVPQRGSACQGSLPSASRTCTRASSCSSMKRYFHHL